MGLSAHGVVCPGGVSAREGGLVSARGGVCLDGGVSAWGVSAQMGVSAQGVPEAAEPPPPHGQKNTCENITFANFVCGR